MDLECLPQERLCVRYGRDCAFVKYTTNCIGCQYEPRSWVYPKIVGGTVIARSPSTLRQGSPRLCSGQARQARLRINHALSEANVSATKPSRLAKSGDCFAPLRLRSGQALRSLATIASSCAASPTSPTIWCPGTSPAGRKARSKAAPRRLTSPSGR